MPEIGINPLVLKDVLFRVADDEYQAHCSAVVFTPSSSISTWKGLTPSSVHSAGSAATWTCDLTYAQDWDTEGSLSRYLYEHEGEEVNVEFQPRRGIGPSFTATIIIQPGAIGGQVDTFGETSVSCGSKGRPQLVPEGAPEA